MSHEALEALAWYGEQARLARLIHREGDAGRHALAADGGKRAKSVLANCKAALADATKENALSAKDRELAEALADPIVVHRNMLRGTIAKPSMNNIAHLYPEVQQMKEALLSTLKHFRWPTSSERETRDKVLAALAHFDEPPSSVLSSVQPVSGSREQRGNEEG